MIPKSKDFEYMDKFKGILKVIESKDYISFDEILGFHIKEVHYKMRDHCPATCNQEEYCGIMRSCFIFATKIVEKLREIDGEEAIVGIMADSTKENTGHIAGTIRATEEKMDKNLIWVICSLHTLERQLR